MVSSSFCQNPLGQRSERSRSGQNCLLTRYMNGHRLVLDLFGRLERLCDSNWFELANDLS
jgi:hypothetical protein